MSNGKLERWALISEIIGTLAIVFSLLFVAYEVRQNTSANYAVTQSSLNNAQLTWRSNLLSTPGLLEVWENQVGVEVNAGVLVAEQLLLIYEQAYFAQKYKRLGDGEWGRYEASMCRNPSTIVLASEVPTVNFTEEFWTFLLECNSGLKLD